MEKNDPNGNASFGELNDELLETVSGGVSVGDVITLKQGEIKYCSNCGKLLDGVQATVTGVRGTLNGENVYSVTCHCCGEQSSAIQIVP